MSRQPQQRLTEATCLAAACALGRKHARFWDGGGLYLEVFPSGTKLWRWKYRIGPKEKRIALGAYPSVSLEMARAERDCARTVLQNGTDPVAFKNLPGQPLERAEHAVGVLFDELRRLGRADSRFGSACSAAVAELESVYGELRRSITSAMFAGRQGS